MNQKKPKGTNKQVKQLIKQKIANQQPNKPTKTVIK
jgi:hypothetical protein